MTENFDTIIIGAGQAGLSIGYYLSKLGREFVILEQASNITPTWRGRWDSFTLVLPNWTYQIPDHGYDGDDPDGFMDRDELVVRLEKFADSFNPDIRFGSKVTSVRSDQNSGNLRVNTEGSSFAADNVVVAAGTFQSPRLPPFSNNLAEDINQIHTSEYQNPDSLPEGAVLVVGTGQSGCQIAEELYLSGRKVFLCVGGANRVPRRYRGKDIIYWLDKINFFDQTADSLSSSKERFAAHPFVTGKDGGRSLNLHQFAKDGVVLLGHMKDAQGYRVQFIPDLRDNLKKVDQFVVDLKQRIDNYIIEHNIDAEEAPRQIELNNGYESEIIEELDLRTEGISTIIWATGYKFDFSWVDFPIFDQDGYPIQDRGVSEVPGLFFLGLHFLYKRRSGLLWGVGEDAAHVAKVIGARD
ncbi:MAG: NAD(P)-binding domain-containing protein [Chloroflexota bacterium]|nr:MAG: NAD(P)-binding domain-containing protein [Chloroflexota bacterium]